MPARHSGGHRISKLATRTRLYLRTARLSSPIVSWVSQPGDREPPEVTVRTGRSDLADRGSGVDSCFLVTLGGVAAVNVAVLPRTTTGLSYAVS